MTTWKERVWRSVFVAAVLSLCGGFVGEEEAEASCQTMEVCVAVPGWICVLSNGLALLDYYYIPEELIVFLGPSG